MGNEGCGSLISLDGVAPSRIVGVSVSDISPCTIKSRRRSGTGSPGWSWEMGRKMVVCFVLVLFASVVLGLVSSVLCQEIGW